MDNTSDAGDGARRDIESRRRKSPGASLTSGLVFTAAFGIAWYVTRQWFFVFPLVFAGLMPLVEGLRRLASDRSRPQLPNTTGGTSPEKQILLVAKEQKGVVTPALIALKSDLSIQEAEKALEEMARRGYAQIRVTDSGRIEYEFPEFMPHTGAEEGRV